MRREPIEVRKATLASILRKGRGLLPCSPQIMQRYYFPIRGVNLTLEDDSGQSFATVRDATIHAAALAGELAEEGYGGAYEDCTVCVLDGTGAEVARVAIQTMTH